MRIDHAMLFALIVVGVVIIARAIVAVGFNRGYAWYLRRHGLPEVSSVRQALLASWCGMRGLVTLATAFALPSDFPQRDLVVLIAFGVVIATLVVQGLTLGPVIRLLRLDRHESGASDVAKVRKQIAHAALASLDRTENEEAAPLRTIYGFMCEAILEPATGHRLIRFREHAMAAIAAQRAELERARLDNRINVSEYNDLLEDIDWWEIIALPDEGRRIEET